MPQTFQDRLGNIAQLLTEIAAGNFCFAVPHQGEDNELDVVLDLVTGAIEELRRSLFRRGQILRYGSNQYLVQSTFLLDRSRCIKDFTTEGIFLPRSLHSVAGLPFYRLLEADSIPEWEAACDAVRKNKQFRSSVQVYFSHHKPSRPSFCHIYRLLYSEKILVRVITVVYDGTTNSPLLSGQGGSVTPEEEAGLRLHDYIFANLQAPLPPIKDLAIKFGTNEFYLKKAFRKLFNTSIFKFYNEERLKRAHLLIQQTKLPLYEIADSCGFSAYHNFSRVFTKRFGYSASALRRRTR